MVGTTLARLNRRLWRRRPFRPPRVDDRRVMRGIIYVIRNGLQWKDMSLGPVQNTACICIPHSHCSAWPLRDVPCGSWQSG
jgi:transposase